MCMRQHQQVHKAQLHVLVESSHALIWPVLCIAHICSASYKWCSEERSHSGLIGLAAGLLWQAVML